MTAARHLDYPTTTPAERVSTIGGPAVRPAPHTTPEHPTAGSPRALLVLAGFVMLGVLLASVSGIAEVAALVKMPEINVPNPSGGELPLTVPIGTIGLILAWDGLQVTAAWAVHTGRDRAALGLLIATATASGAAQGWAGVLAVLHEPTDPEASVGFLVAVALVHASPAVALIGAEALVFRAAARAMHHAPAEADTPVPPAAVASVESPAVASVEAPAIEPPAPAELEQAPARPTVVALAKPATTTTRRTTRRAPARQTPAAEVDETVVELVRQALTDMGVEADDVTRDGVLDHLRNGPAGTAPHARKVSAALRHLRGQGQ